MISIIIPVKDEHLNLPLCLENIGEALHTDDVSSGVVESGIDHEVLVVDDHSRHGYDRIIHDIQEMYPQMRICVLSNAGVGRFSARRTGALAAAYDLLMFVDARVCVGQRVLSHLQSLRLSFPHVSVWNGDIQIAPLTNPFACFWHLVAHILWPAWFRNRSIQTVEGGQLNRLPRGTGLLAAGRQDFLSACSIYDNLNDTRFVSDDTLLIDRICDTEGFGISSEFYGVYRARQETRPFFRQCFYRGRTFTNGHLASNGRIGRIARAVTLIAGVWLSAATYLTWKGEIVSVGVLILSAIFSAGAVVWWQSRAPSLYFRHFVLAGVASLLFVPAFLLGIIWEVLTSRRAPRL